MLNPEEETLNSEIRDLLIEISGNASTNLQVEITCLFQQIHRINCLINQEQNSWLNRLINKKNYHSELTLWLEEIKNMLMIVKAGHSNIDTVREFRINLQKNVNNVQYLGLGQLMNIFLRIYHIKSIPFKILIGLMITTSIAVTALTISINKVVFPDLEKLAQDQQVSHENNTNKSLSKQEKVNLHDQKRHLLFALVYAISGGVLGSVVSILLRIIEFKDKKYDDPSIPFFIGMFKPVIGLIFGIFLYCLINSRTIVKIDFNTSGNELLKSAPYINENFRHDFFLFTCAFLMGFSERFASDLISKSESIVNGTLSPQSNSANNNDSQTNGGE